MADIAKRLETLKRLLDQKAAQPLVKEVVDAEEPPAPQVQQKSGLLPFDPTVTPPRLRGLSYDEIHLLEVDGYLNEQEMVWLACKTPPGRMPSLKYLQMVGQQKLKGEQR